MCGATDFETLHLMGERIIVLGIAVVGGIATYHALSSVREKHYNRFGRSIDKIMSYLRLR